VASPVSSSAVAPALTVRDAAPRVIAAGLAACLLAYGFSRVSGLLAESVILPVGTAAFVVGVGLTARSPQEYGWRWGRTREHVRLLVGALVAIVVVVRLFVALAGSTPYEPSLAEVVLVPLGEEALFRGLVLVVLVGLFARWLPGPRAVPVAVVVSAVAYGVGHLGNLGYVPTFFVLVQAVAATVFGLLAGWVRLRTDSLAGPVLLHTAMNTAAVL
jgi:membrane protease YdiL (CAAX protease family)